MTTAIAHPTIYRCRGVSSDCMPVDAFAELSLDASSGLITARLDDAWIATVKRIYENYAIYAQAGGAEQLVFDQGSGASASRSSQIVDRALGSALRATSGRCLDVGCGNGAFLRAFGVRFPDWKLEGTEFDEKSLPVLRTIPGFERLHTATPLGDLPRAYHVVSMIHVLEHLTDPLTWLEHARELLVDDGLLLIQVPYFVENPFELAIYDHCSHFTQASLRRLVRAAGFEVIQLGSHVVPKEITLVARPLTDGQKPLLEISTAELDAETERLRLAGAWLDATLTLAADATTKWKAKRRSCALFGSSIAATLIHQHCGNAFDRFIDEDRNRQGSSHLGVPIVGIDAVAENSGVFVGLTPTIAQAVKQRALPRSSAWVVPAPFPPKLAESSASLSDRVHVRVTPTASISVVIPHFNDGPHLEALLRSIIDQPVRPLEVVIADDASTQPLSPAAAALLRAHAWIKFHRFADNVGPVANTNRAVALANGDYLVPRSANDLLDREYLSRLVDALERFPHAPIVASSVTYFATTPENGSREDLGWGSETAFLEADEFADVLCEQHLLHGVGIAISRKELERIGGFDERLRWYADWWATMRIALESGLVTLPGNGGFFRMNPESYGNALTGRERHQDDVLATVLDIAQASSPALKAGLQRSSLLGFFGARLLALASTHKAAESLLPLLERTRESQARLTCLSPLRRHILARLQATRVALDHLSHRESNTAIWIYGAGSFGEQVLGAWRELGLRTPNGFIVSASQRPRDAGTPTFAGLPLAALESLDASFTGLVVLASKSYEAAFHHNVRLRCPHARILSFYDRSFTRL